MSLLSLRVSTYTLGHISCLRLSFILILFVMGVMVGIVFSEFFYDLFDGFLHRFNVRKFIIYSFVLPEK